MLKNKNIFYNKRSELFKSFSYDSPNSSYSIYILSFKQMICKGPSYGKNQPIL